METSLEPRTSIFDEMLELVYTLPPFETLKQLEILIHVTEGELCQSLILSNVKLFLSTSKEDCPESNIEVWKKKREKITGVNFSNILNLLVLCI